jgi:ABC-type transport system involved in multi-copper enzyme maturation permease subunit
MRAVFLLSANFVRTQWIPVAMMTAYLIAAGGLFGWHQQRADVQFYVQWHSYNAVFIGTLIAVPAIWSERRSRRILAVLSKGISRWQYLAGLLCGCALISFWFCVLIGGITAWLCLRGGMPAGSLLSLMVVLFLCSVTAESAGLLSAVGLHPLVAMIATSAFLLLPFALEPAGWYLPAELFPVASLMQVLRDFHFQALGTGIWRIADGAILETILFSALGGAIFSRRDVTISPE